MKFRISTANHNETRNVEAIDVIETNPGIWVVEAKNENEAAKKLWAVLETSANSDLEVLSGDEEDARWFYDSLKTVAQLMELKTSSFTESVVEPTAKFTNPAEALAKSEHRLFVKTLADDSVPSVSEIRARYHCSKVSAARIHDALASATEVKPSPLHSNRDTESSEK